VPSPEGPPWTAWLYLDPPLDFNLDVDGKRHNFRPEIDALLEEKSVAKFAALVKERANQRNRLLYAAAQGIPHIVNAREILDDTNGRVRLHVAVYLMIDTVKVHQQFVVQVLDALCGSCSSFPTMLRTGATPALDAASYGKNGPTGLFSLAAPPACGFLILWPSGSGDVAWALSPMSSGCPSTPL